MLFCRSLFPIVFLFYALPKLVIDSLYGKKWANRNGMKEQLVKLDKRDQILSTKTLKYCGALSQDKMIVKIITECEGIYF